MIRAVVGILEKDNKILITQRPPGKPYSGFWEFPGGKIEADEASQDALIRELYEELGIKVTSAHPWFTHHHAYPDKTVSLEMWWVTEFSGEPKGQENQILKWATYSEMLNLSLLEGNWPILERIKSFLDKRSSE